MIKNLCHGWYLVAVLLALTACSPAAAPVTPTQNPIPTAASAPASTVTPTDRRATDGPREAERLGGTLTLVEGGFTQFDPIFCADDPSFHAISQIFSLLYRNLDGRIIPDLATSWDFQDDGKTVIFHLRRGVMFHDDNAVFAKGQSREVVAEDVVYSIKRLVETRGSAAFPDLTAVYQDVEAVDQYTVRLSLKAPDALLFSYARGLSNAGIVPHEAIEKLGDRFAQNPVGSGPFKFSEYKPDDQLTLVRNDLYWRKPYLDKVVYKIIPDDSVAILSLESGEVDVVGLPSTEFERFNGNAKYSLYPVKTCPVPTQLMFNIGDAPYNDQQFRQAVSYALDGQAIGRSIVKDMFVPGAGTAGPGVPGYDEDLANYFIYDPQKARALLDALGYLPGPDGMRLNKDGTPLTLQLEIWSMSSMPQYGAAIVTQLEDVGLKAELQTLEFGAFLDDWATGPHKMMIMEGWCGDGGTSGLWGRTGMATSLGYADEQISSLLEQSNQTMDPARRDEIIRQAADMIYSRYWAIPLGFQNFYQISSARVHDFHPYVWFENLVTEENNVWVTP